MRTLVLALALAATASAQVPPDLVPVALRLQAAGLLPDTPDDFGPPASRADLLDAVGRHLTDEMMGGEREPGFTAFFFTGEEPPDTLHAFTERLLGAGAVSPRVHERLLALVADGGAPARLALAQYAALWTRAEDRFLPGPLAEGLDALVRTGALTAAERTALDRRLAAGEIESSAALASALPTGVAVPSVGEEAPEDAVARALQAVADALRQRGVVLEVGAVSATPALRDRFDDNRHFDLVVRAEVNGRTYAASSFFGFSDTDAPPPPGDLVLNALGELATSLLNKALRDGDLPYRVYAVLSDPYVPSDLALLALTEAQAEAATASPLGLLAAYDILRDDTLTTERVAEGLALFRQLGLLSGTDEAERLAALDVAYPRTPHDVLRVLGFTLSVDFEMADLETPYTSLLADLAALSRGAFHPKAVEGVFDWDAERASLAFALGGQRYAAKLAFDGDWMDRTVFGLVERATAEAGAGRFYWLREGEWGGEELVFLTDRQRAALEAAGWVRVVGLAEPVE